MTPSNVRLYRRRLTSNQLRKYVLWWLIQSPETLSIFLQRCRRIFRSGSSKTGAKMRPTRKSELLCSGRYFTRAAANLSFHHMVRCSTTRAVTHRVQTLSTPICTSVPTRSLHSSMEFLQITSSMIIVMSPI